ncbi:MAG: hypothetical protein KDK48_00065 [Chlamydiia bacterium]|nr:hypothetical protein [Chlamydiia bacterium]
MKVKCKFNSKNNLPSSLKSTYPISLDSLDLIVGSEYIVYSVSFIKDALRYSVCDSNYTYWPRYRQAFLFDIIDDRPSRYWIVKDHFSNDLFSAIFAFKEWALEDRFYDNLIDGKSKEVELFKLYKEKMDLEFGDFSIELSAEVLDSAWVLCPSCHDAWECSNVVDELIKCANCKEIVKNPRVVGS